MSIGLSSGDNTIELAALVAELDRMYDTSRTNALVEMVHEVIQELRQHRRCQYCQNETTRWMCDKPHVDN